MTPDVMIEKYIALRNKVAVLKQRHLDELEPFQSVMRQLETHLLTYLEEHKLDSIKAEQGTAYKQLATSVTVQEWSEALEYIKQHELWDMLEARVAKNAALTVVEERKEPIPGVKISQALVLRVRAA